MRYFYAFLWNGEVGCKWPSGRPSGVLLAFKGRKHREDWLGWASTCGEQVGITTSAVTLAWVRKHCPNALQHAQLAVEGHCSLLGIDK